MKINVGGTERDVRILFSEQQIQARTTEIARPVDEEPPLDGQYRNRPHIAEVLGC